MDDLRCKNCEHCKEFHFVNGYWFKECVNADSQYYHNIVAYDNNICVNHSSHIVTEAYVKEVKARNRGYDI